MKGSKSLPRCTMPGCKATPHAFRLCRKCLVAVNREILKALQSRLGRANA
jgi:hypothetical protein